MRLRLLALATLTATDCADDQAELTATFERQCDQDGPVELLRLTEEEEVFHVADVELGGDFVVWIGAADELAPDPSPLQRTVVVDRCGDTATQTAPDVWHVFANDDWLLGCVGWELVVLESHDDATPTHLGASCGVVVVDGVALATDYVASEFPGTPEPSTRVLELYEEAGALTTRVIFDGLGAQGAFQVDRDRDELFVQDVDGNVMKLHPRSGEVDLLLTEVGLWDVDRDWILFFPSVDSVTGLATLAVLQRSTGELHVLASDIASPLSRFGIRHGALAVVGWASDDTQRWFHLDPPAEVSPPPGLELEAVHPDGTVWLRRPAPDYGEAMEILRWPPGAPPEVALSCFWCRLVDTGDGGVHVHEETPAIGTWDLWQLHDHGEAALLLADEVHHDAPVVDPHLAVRPTCDPPSGSCEHGALLLFDGTAPAGTLVAPDANFAAPTLSSFVGDARDIVYETGPASETHALYRARLTAP